MLISEFIKSYEIEKVKTPDLGGLLDECLNHLIQFYGYLGNIHEPETWYLDKLEFDEILPIEEPDKLLFDIDNTSLQMANECEFYVSSDPKKHYSFKQKKKDDTTKNSTLNHWMKLSPKYNEKLEKKKKQEKAHKPKQFYTYKDRTKLTNADGNLVTIDAVKIPLILAMKDLIQAHLGDQDNVSLIIRATKLISASKHLRLLIRLSEQWEDSQNRRIDKNANTTIDSDPINVEKIKILKKLVDEKMTENSKLTPDQLYTELNTKFYGELDDSIKNGKLSELDKNSKSKPNSKYERDISITNDNLIKRWIKEHHESFLNNQQLQ